MEVGDVVTLKSGGPDMTVEAVYPDTNQVKCVWFEGGKRSNDVFFIKTLEIVDNSIDL
jgi:uncharacterized protein YodC (DUF2158 family)